MNQYFDQILPLNSAGTEVGGFIQVLNEDFYLQITLIEGPPKKFKLKGSWKLSRLIKPIEKVLEQHFEQCNTFLDVLQELQNTLEQQLHDKKEKQLADAAPLRFYKELLEQLEECGWDKVHYINTELSKLQLKAIDSYDREHFLHITLPAKFPAEAPTYQTDTPREFEYNWTLKSTLQHLYEHFESCVASYNLFWDCMDEIDNNTWVLEPEKPNRSDCKRRIVLGSLASLLVTVNPDAPTAVPMYCFLGPEKIVGPMREKLNSNLRKWDEGDSLLFNLKHLMELDFPSPSSTTKEDFHVECGICYAYQIDEEFPTVLCEHQNCNEPFHRSCLFEWLKSLTTGMQSFNVLFGNCPYCNKPISVTKL